MVSEQQGEKQFAASTSPFREKVDVERFFEGGNRRTILERVKSSVDDGIPFLTLMGEDGCGKTMLCRMVEKELPAGHVSVFFPVKVDSFEDVVRIIAQELDVLPGASGEKEDIPRLLAETVTRLQDKNRRLLIIFDEAEQIYLATLERIRKMIDQVNGEQVVVQFLFAGRMLLEENLKQLSMCSFNEAAEKHFTLDPLKQEEVFEYLQFKMVFEPKMAPRFSREMAETIYGRSQGNIRLMNVVAEEALQSSTSDTSFMALLDQVSEPEKKDSAPKRKRRRPAMEWHRWLSGSQLEKVLEQRSVLVAAAVLILAVLFIMVVFTEEPPQQQVAEDEPVEVEYAAAEDIAPPKSSAADTLKSEKETAAVPAPAPAPVKVAPQQHKVAAKIAPAEEVAKKTPSEQPATQDEAVVKKEPAAPPQQQEKAQQEASPAGSKGPLLDEGIDVDKLYRQRIGATAKWLVGAKNDSFTVQLMVLTSDQAEANLKRMLALPEYQGVSEELFILRRILPQPTVLVFYGEYATMNEARNARNTLPLFLRKHHPYAISVKGAVEKAKK